MTDCGDEISSQLAELLCLELSLHLTISNTNLKFPINIIKIPLCLPF